MIIIINYVLSNIKHFCFCPREYEKAKKMYNYILLTYKIMSRDTICNI